MLFICIVSVEFGSTLLMGCYSIITLEARDFNMFKHDNAFLIFIEIIIHCSSLYQLDGEVFVSTIQLGL